MQCEALYFEKSTGRSVVCATPFARKVIVTGTLCSVMVCLCEYHADGLSADGYLVDWAAPEISGAAIQ